MCNPLLIYRMYIIYICSNILIFHHSSQCTVSRTHLVWCSRPAYMYIYREFTRAQCLFIVYFHGDVTNDGMNSECIFANSYWEIIMLF